MSGVGDFLFGTKPKQAKAKDLTPEEFVGLRGNVAGGLRNIITSGGGERYGGPMAAQITGEETDLLSQLRQLVSQPAGGSVAGSTLERLAGGETNAFAGAVGLSDAERRGLGVVEDTTLGNSALTDQSRAALMELISGAGLEPGSNPFLQAAIDSATRPIIDQFGDASGALQADFARAGQTVAPNASSPFDVARARLTGNVANAIGDVSGDLAFRNYDSERNRILQGLGLAEQIPGLDTSRALAGLEALGLPREVAQGGIDRQAAAFESGADRQLAAADASSNFSRGQVEDTLRVLEANALPRLIEQLGIDRGLQEFQRQQQALLQALGQAGGLASPTAAVLPGTPGQIGFLQSTAAGAAAGLAASGGGGA